MREFADDANGDCEKQRNLSYPRTAKQLRFEAPLPKALAALHNALKNG